MSLTQAASLVQKITVHLSATIYAYFGKTWLIMGRC